MASLDNTTSYETDDVATDFSYPAADQGERATTGSTALDNTLLGITGPDHRRRPGLLYPVCPTDDCSQPTSTAKPCTTSPTV